MLLSESIQGMRDGSFGPLNTGRNDIRIITSAIRHYSRGIWFLERGKKYIKARFEFKRIFRQAKARQGWNWAAFCFFGKKY